MERQCVQRIAKVHDQHLSFIALEAGLFSLGLPNSYLAINDPGANDTQIEVGLSSGCAWVWSIPVQTHPATSLPARAPTVCKPHDEALGSCGTLRTGPGGSAFSMTSDAYACIVKPDPQPNPVSCTPDPDP